MSEFTVSPANLLLLKIRSLLLTNSVSNSMFLKTHARGWGQLMAVVLLWDLKGSIFTK